MCMGTNLLAALLFQIKIHKKVKKNSFYIEKTMQIFSKDAFFQATNS